MADIWHIGDRVKDARVAAGLSQEGLGEKIGVKRQTIGKWETGSTYPDTENLEKLCGVFACDLAYLLGEIDTRRRVAADISEVTGLSEPAIEYLSSMKRNAHNFTAWRLDDDADRKPLENPYRQELGVINALLEEDAQSGTPGASSALRGLFYYVLRSLPDTEYFEIVAGDNHIDSFSREELEDASLYTSVMLAVKLFKQKYAARMGDKECDLTHEGGAG